MILAFIPLLLLFASNAFAGIALDSTNATYKNGPIFSWPIAGTLCASDSAWAAVLYSPDYAILAQTDSLKLSVASSLTNTANRDVVVEYVATDGSVGSVNINGSSSNLRYDGGTQNISITLSDFCSRANLTGGKGGGNCTFNDHDIVDATSTVRIGVIVSTAVPHSFSNGLYTNGTADMDYSTYSFRLVRCPTHTNAFTGGLETYAISVKPGDGRATVSFLNSPDVLASDFAIIGKFFMFQESETLLSTNMTLTDAKRTVFSSGTGAGQTIVDGLTNDKTYNVQMAYVNEGGLISRPGPPNPSGNAPQVIPSQIAGFIGDNPGCFLATVAYEDNAFWLSPLREFRDDVLLSFPAGRKFVQWYYSWSPQAAGFVVKHPWLRPFLFLGLSPMVLSVKLMMFLWHFV